MRCEVENATDEDFSARVPKARHVSTRAQKRTTQVHRLPCSCPSDVACIGPCVTTHRRPASRPTPAADCLEGLPCIGLCLPLGARMLLAAYTQRGVGASNGGMGDYVRTQTGCILGHLSSRLRQDAALRRHGAWVSAHVRIHTWALTVLRLAEAGDLGRMRTLCRAGTPAISRTTGNATAGSSATYTYQ